MRQIDLLDRFVTSDTDAEALEIDAEAVVRELSPPDLPHDPPVDEFPADVFIKVSTCPICGSTHGTPRFAIRGTEYRLVVCCECGLGSLQPKPGPQEIAKFYPPEYYGAPGAKFRSLTEALIRKSSAWTAAKLMKDVPAGSRILDVGCGRGVLLSSLADLGFETHGFEISSTAAEGADPRAVITTAPSLQEAHYPDSDFDVVVLCHVLEHLPNPMETLLEIRRILKPGGRLVVSVPNLSSWQARSMGAAWFHLDLPRHLYHFPVSALREILRQTGFDCQREEYFCLRQNPFGWVQSLLNKWCPAQRNALYTQLKRCPGSRPSVPWWKRAVMRAAYWFGMPVALLLSLVCAAFRNGATITIIAGTTTTENPRQTLPELQELSA